MKERRLDFIRRNWEQDKKSINNRLEQNIFLLHDTRLKIIKSILDWKL